MKNKIAKIRKDRGMTQEELAEKIETGKGMLSLLESGKRTLNTRWIDKICDALECKPSDILDGDYKDNSLDDWQQDIVNRISELHDMAKEDQEYIDRTLDMLAEKYGKKK